MAKVLKVGVEMGGLKDEAEIELPADWDSWTAAEQQSWADGALETHVQNNVDSWHYVDEA
ncbi:hypothetical protein [Streptomyces sp. NPDC003720]|uniref:hypothetical protein n=1 Tax=Streptomyces sp. NPDC003720 TaxID=3364684 RepID=UPI0036CD0EE3